MNSPSMPRPALLASCAGIVAAACAAYSLSLGGAFLYDDAGSAVGNPSLQHLSSALMPPNGVTVSGRPILNLSFALNQWISGTEVWSYHALNLAIHVAGALLLFGVIRRTLAAPAAGSRSGTEGVAVAFAAALLWAVHPLQVESVAYVVQRAESLMGMFYLLTLYAFVRFAAARPGGAGWAAVSVAACLLGMGTKEVMATAPLIVLLYDRAFVGGSFREAWTRRKTLYLCYAACWLPLAVLVIHAAGRGGSAGFGSGVPWWAYALTQFKAVALYLRLSFWPRPLIGDYGRILEGNGFVVATCAAFVFALAAATWSLLRRNSPLGFLGAWFLVILAPSSSVIPISTEIIAEHRMYLPLAAVMLLVALAANALLGRRLFLVAVCLLAAGLAVLTVRRTRVYGSGFTFWSDVVRKVPGNAGGWNNLGNLRSEQGDGPGAMEDYRRALALAPAFASAHYNLGKALAATGHAAEAVTHYEEALKFRPEDASIHYNMGDALALAKRPFAAAAEYREALRLDPDRSDAWFRLGDTMTQVGNLPEAAVSYSHAVLLRPDFADARLNYGNVLAQQGRFAEAVAQFKEALRLEPNAADIHNNLGSLLAESGQGSQARAEFEEALRLKPDYKEAQDNLKRLDSSR